MIDAEKREHDFEIFYELLRSSLSFGDEQFHQTVHQNAKNYAGFLRSLIRKNMENTRNGQRERWAGKFYNLSESA